MDTDNWADLDSEVKADTVNAEHLGEFLADYQLPVGYRRTGAAAAYRAVANAKDLWAARNAVDLLVSQYRGRGSSHVDGAADVQARLPEPQSWADFE